MVAVAYWWISTADPDPVARYAPRLARVRATFGGQHDTSYQACLPAAPPRMTTPSSLRAGGVCSVRWWSVLA
jgi:hypothetical protein